MSSLRTELVTAPCVPFGKKQGFKIVICVALYSIYGNLLLGEAPSDSASNVKKSLENGGNYIFMITSAILFSFCSMKQIGFQASGYILLFFDTIATILLTNIAVSLYWLPVERLCDLTLKAFADLVSRLHKLTDLTFLNSIATFLDNSGKYLATLISLVLLIWVLERLQIFQYIYYIFLRLFKKPSVSITSQRSNSSNPRPRQVHRSLSQRRNRRLSRCPRIYISDGSDSDI